MAESNFTCIPNILMDRGYETMSVFVQTMTPKIDVEMDILLFEFSEENSSVWLPLVSIATAKAVFCLLVVLSVALLAWVDKKRNAALRKETESVQAEYFMSTELRFQEFQIKVSEKRERFNRSTEKISATGKRVQSVYTHLDNVKELYDNVYEDMRYWKMTWINQTAKLRQINTRDLNRMIKSQYSIRDKLEFHKRYVRGFIAETEHRFCDIFHRMRCDKKAMNTIERDVSMFQTRFMGNASLAANRRF